VDYGYLNFLGWRFESIPDGVNQLTTPP